MVVRTAAWKANGLTISAMPTRWELLAKLHRICGHEPEVWEDLYTHLDNIQDSGLWQACLSKLHKVSYHSSLTQAEKWEVLTQKQAIQA